MIVLLVLVKVCPFFLICMHAYLESSAADKFAKPVSGPHEVEQDHSLLWLMSCFSFLFYELYVAYRALSIQAITLLHALGSALGIVLFAYGVFLRLSAIRGLRAAFDIPPWPLKEVSLKTDGVFGWVRHPSELGLTLICLGLALAGHSLAAFGACAFVLFPLTLLRIKQEERWLMRQTQGAYAGYRASVPCLCPIFRQAGGPLKARPGGRGTGLAQG
jgi:protein-S-isoprenylcysteine O-methyltransferase Ste14